MIYRSNVTFPACIQNNSDNIGIINAVHELSVTESILSISTSHAQKASADRVTDIYLVIGELSSIVDDSVQFYWDIISQETICAGAQLHFKRIPARFRCQECSHEYTITGEMQPCPQCGSYRLRVLAGEEFYVESIAVEAG
jgi:hydrogenase nickel incorporation protein HypA/HybF